MADAANAAKAHADLNFFARRELYKLVDEEQTVKIYAGDRTIDGIDVTVDGQPLDPCFELANFSPGGFEWTFEGDGPRQLALAILNDHLADGSDALDMADAFMRLAVANFENTWEMSSSDVASFIEAIRNQS